MNDQEQFESALEAYGTARRRAAAAVVVEQNTLHTLIQISADLGHSIRETARYLQVPKSTVARHRVTVPDRWGDVALEPEEFLQAHNAAWAHDPSQQMTRAPFAVEDHGDGTRTVRLT